MADPDRETVYACERRLTAAIGSPGGRIDAHGRVWALEPDTRFATLAEAQLWVTLTCIEQALPPVTVRHRGGDVKSHYEPKTSTVALASWGGARLTLCHELAHHWTTTHHQMLGHGAAFRAALCGLLAAAGAPEQAAFLRATFESDGLVVPRPHPAGITP